MGGDALDLLWRRLEEAKRHLDRCHNHLREIAHDTNSGALPLADGNYAYARGLKEEKAATESYLDALQAFKEALRKVPQPASAKVVAEAGDASGLTPRERQVLALVASGKSSREIAKELGISFKTVTTHRYRLQTKLNAHHTADLTRIAMKMGLVEP